ncbi:leucine-rich repeat and IQ domain-containing protein 4-like isoform X2 [Aphis gossypii]|uniref:leucine-rich repeat and IQ domain-containing protein 4-like isoform X2 n=1 Tax=Aphis gossypii TaxID=80765 RepID=UPI0021590961|nr:leucine-rich repeat and IQ domain-containing protein 4-like isoform X2 [Aphis gossypii]
MNVYLLKTHNHDHKINTFWSNTNFSNAVYSKPLTKNTCENFVFDMLRKITAMTLGIGHILHWNDRNLFEFPEDLKLNRDRVYQLYIKNNFIEVLPGWINSLDKLTHIYMDNNKLSTFPAEICELKGLEVLCAPRNSITDIPSTIAALKRLTQLNLSHNRIRKVPGDVLNMPSLWLLDLSHNEIETLPEIYPDGLYYGEILLNGNKLISVPDNLGRLKNIEYLSLAHNKLLYVPAVAFRSEASINVDHNPFLNYVPTTIKAENCGTQQFLEAHMLPNITLTCNSRNLIVSPKIKEVFCVQGNAHCPTLKEFALRALYVWKTPFYKDWVPKNLCEQLSSGPAASCMQCLRPLFTYTYICILQYDFFFRSHTHFNAQYFCSKSCHGAFKQITNRYQMDLQELDFKIKPYGFFQS